MQNNQNAQPKPTFRHGDVMLVPISKLPEKMTPLPKAVLALGEVTGHSHRMEGGAAVLYETAPFEFDPAFDLEVTRVLRVAEESLLTHEEHKALTIPVGDYAVVPQRDYTPDGWAFVQD